MFIWLLLGLLFTRSKPGEYFRNTIELGARQLFCVVQVVCNLKHILRLIYATPLVPIKMLSQRNAQFHITEKQLGADWSKKKKSHFLLAVNIHAWI